jgi:hypothetical protein
MTNTGALLFDGASRKKALVWLSQTYPEHSLRPLLHGTAYQALADIGPILLDAEEGSALHTAWLQGSPDLQHAVWLRTEVSLDRLRTSLMQRLRILSPDGREFWLRLADARPLLNAWQAQVQWPAGFWYGITEIWLRDRDGPFSAWSNEAPERDCSIATQDINAQIILDWPLLQALAQDKESTPEAAV